MFVDLHKFDDFPTSNVEKQKMEKKSEAPVGAPLFGAVLRDFSLWLWLFLRREPLSTGKGDENLYYVLEKV